MRAYEIVRNDAASRISLFGRGDCIGSNATWCTTLTRLFAAAVARKNCAPSPTASRIKKPREDIEKWANEYDQMALFAEQIKQSWRSLLYTGRSSGAGNRRRSR